MDPMLTLTTMPSYSLQTHPTWQIPSHMNHPVLAATLQWICQKKLLDYQALRLMATSKPPNDLTCLCQVLGTEGAGQHLSGDRQTIHFKDFLEDYEQLFYELEERLVSKTACNTWYELCGHPIPNPPDQEQCTKDFRHLDNKWKR